MSLIVATVTGSLSKQMREEVKLVSAGLRRAVDRTGRTVKERLRQQARSAGFKDNGRAVGNAWRQRTYPYSSNVVTFNPASEIKTNMPDAAEAFDKGAIIVVRGTKWLVWPTGFNAALGRYKAGGQDKKGKRRPMRIDPEQMSALHKTKQTFILKSKSNPGISLWCIRVFEATGLKRGGAKGKGRLKLFVGGGTEVATGKVKGQLAWRKKLLKQGFVPMFFMSKRTTLRKRLDIDAVRRQAEIDLYANIVEELRR